jgi:hypothetical protein
MIHLPIASPNLKNTQNKTHPTLGARSSNTREDLSLVPYCCNSIICNLHSGDFKVFQSVFGIVWMDASIGSTIEPLRNLGHTESCCKKDLVHGTTSQYTTYLSLRQLLNKTIQGTNSNNLIGQNFFLHTKAQAYDAITTYRY